MKFFNNEAEIVKTRNRVPHWQQEAATFFVTWRLKDSIPREMLDKLYTERAEWENKHLKPWTEKQEEEYHTKFSAETERLLDIGYGECVLRQPRCREAVAKSLRLFDSERFLMHSWVAMPNHVHALFSLEEIGWCRRRVENIHREGYQRASWPIRCALAKVVFRQDDTRLGSHDPRGTIHPEKPREDQTPRR